MDINNQEIPESESLGTEKMTNRQNDAKMLRGK